MSATSSGMRGGQPSTTQPIAAPWLSPKLVKRNIWPKVLNDMAVFAVREGGTARPVGGQISRRRSLTAAMTFGHRRAESLKQCAVDGISLRLVLGMPLRAQGKTRRIGDADRLDGAVFRDALDHDALAWLEDALAVQRIDADGLLAQQLREDAARREAHVVPLAVNYV